MMVEVCTLHYIRMRQCIQCQYFASLLDVLNLLYTQMFNKGPETKEEWAKIVSFVLDIGFCHVMNSFALISNSNSYARVTNYLQDATQDQSAASKLNLYPIHI
ncbi:unnamed protein product [Ilex paraguariensis]|uniref:Uncharacterized protein n=1 Tax=Ilex paraguariensis TaxID=185542 RepID=A0ABC8U5Z1_9AQUA